MRTYTKDMYDRVMELRKQNFGAKKISRILNIPKGTIDGWLYKECKPISISEKYRKAQEKNKKYLTGGGWNRKTFPESAKKLSADLAYICGVILGDGYIHKTTGSIELMVKDEDFANNFALFLKKWSTLTPYIYKRKYFVVCLNSIETTKFLLENLNGLIDQIIGTMDEKIICSFLRGLFDSEGSIYYDKKRGNVHLYMGITNRKIAENVKYLLSKIGIESKFYIRKQREGWKTFYKLEIQKRKMQQLFLEKIGFSIQRKQKILEEICNTEFLERADVPSHPWYRRNEIEFIKKHYGSIKTKKIVDKLNKKFWNGKGTRTLNSIYNKTCDLRRENKW